jgi:hypothetical protein
MEANTLVTITYTVPGAKRADFHSLIRSIEETINNLQQGVRCAVYQAEDKPGMYVEVYECDDSDAYDSLEDNLDDDTRMKIQRVATEFAEARQAVTTLRKL